MKELVIDLFAGGGGASLGLEWAGLMVDIAINHDPEAIAVHRANHPHARHFTEDIRTVDPLAATGGQPVGLLWASPDCKHFSKAKGAALVDRNIRSLAWVVVKWARLTRPRIICLENVEEFQTWGPVVAGKPDPARRGLTFQVWVKALHKLGYDVEYRELRACDYGAPTIRKRLFLVARCDGRPIVWPEPTHGPGLAPYRTAAECIDWGLPCPSIFERKRPLAENTLRRIAKGIQKFVINNPNPFIVTYYGPKGDDFRGLPLSQPVPTQTTENRFALVEPFVASLNHTAENYQHFRGQRITQPLRTVTQSPGMGLIQPFMTTPAHSKTTGRAQYIYGMDEPIRTITASSDKALVTAILDRQFGRGAASETDQPLPTVTAGESGKAALVSAFLSKHFGTTIGQQGDEPIHTLTGKVKHGLVTAFMAQHNSGFYDGPGRPADAPISTITHRGTQQQLVTSNLVKLRGTCQHGQETVRPFPTITAGGQHVAEVRAFLVKYYGQGTGQTMSDPAATVTVKDRLGLVTVAGQEYQITDIGMRMLQPRELFRAQGFPDSYNIEVGPNGKRLGKTAQVRLCGNSVCPQLAAALAKANWAEQAERSAGAGN